jgi:DNA-binding winged helix-turn-helix (wHTH) protein
MSQRTPATPGSETPGLFFAGFCLQDDGTLLRGEAPVHLPPKELAALRLLLANSGHIVTPLQLRQTLWGDVHVTADSVPRCVSSLRARLEPDECIQTVYKRGYRFTAAVVRRGAWPERALPRLAIVPFSTGFGVPDYLGPVIAEETIARLGGARPAAISVLARDSVFTLARHGFSALETGETLKADLVLAGTLRALPSHFRLRVEMIRVPDGIQLWVEDLLVARSRIAGLETELADRLTFRLTSVAPADRSSSVGWKAGVPAVPRASKSKHASAAPLDDLSEGLSIAAVAETQQPGSEHQREAYETFQRAHHEWQTLERHLMQDGPQHLLRATELDPSLIGARVDLVNLCVAQSLYGYMSPKVAADIVRRTAESGPEAIVTSANTTSLAGVTVMGHRRRDDVSFPEAWIRAEAILPALGWIRFHVDRHLPAALWAFSFSAHLPHDPWTTRVRSMFALSRHRFGEAIDILRSTILLDPCSPWLQARLAWSLHLAGEAGASVDQILNTLKQFPEHEGANLYGAMILAFNTETERATALAQELSRRLPHFDLATAVHAYALACAGRGDEARTILERLQWLGRERFLLRAFLPAVYLVLGEPDAALAELRTSNDLRCPWFFQMLADPRLKPLEAGPEFLEMRSLLAGMEAEAEGAAEAAS